MFYIYISNCTTFVRKEDVTFEQSSILDSMQTLASGFHLKPSVRYAMFDTVPTLSKYPRWRSHAVAVDLRVSAAALRQRDIVGDGIEVAGRHRGTKIKFVSPRVARRENPLIARSQDFEPRSAMDII